MEYGKLQITLHGGKGLPNVKHFRAMKPYAVVCIAEDDRHYELKSTNIPSVRGTDPEWNCDMEFDDVPMQNDYSLFCKIKHKGKRRDREIGEVKISFAKLLAGDATGEKISYPVRKQSGDLEGEIVISHKFKQKLVGDSGSSSGSVDVDVDVGVDVDENAAVDPPEKKEQESKKEKKEWLVRIGVNTVTVLVGGLSIAADGLSIAEIGG